MTNASDIQLHLQSTPDIASQAVDRLRSLFHIVAEHTDPNPHPQHQVHLDLTVRLIPDDVETIQVHNAWTIYGLNPDGTETETPLAACARPQDWGDPRWVYNRFRFDWLTDAKHYINHFHGWTDLQRAPHEYPGLFAPLIVQILIPGKPAKLCGRDYIAEDDFWFKDWGKMPSIYDPYDEEWE